MHRGKAYEINSVAVPKLYLRLKVESYKRTLIDTNGRGTSGRLRQYKANIRFLFAYILNDIERSLVSIYLVYQLLLAKIPNLNWRKRPLVPW